MAYLALDENGKLVADSGYKPKKKKQNQVSLPNPKEGEVSSFQTSSYNLPPAINVSKQKYNSYNDALNNMSFLSDNEINSALKEAKYQSNNYKKQVYNLAKENNIETSNNKNLVKSLGEYRQESIKNRDYSMPTKPISASATQMAEKSDKNYNKNKEKFDKIVKTSDGYSNYKQANSIASKLKKERDKRNGTWFSSGAFEDGYQFGDITKTTFGTAGDIGLNLLKGVTRAGESIGDLLAYGGAQVVDWFGAHDYAEEVRKAAAEDLTGKVFKSADKLVDNNSFLGEKSDNVINSIGNMYAQSVTSNKILGNKGNVPINIAGKKFNIPVTSLISGASNSMGDAVNKGAEDWQIWLNGVTGGLSEGISESLFGTFGIGGSDLDDIIIDGITKKMKNGLAKSLARAGLKAVGEGTEEVASYLLDYGSSKLIDAFKNNTGLKGPDLAEKFSSEELWDNFFSGTIASGIAGAPAAIYTNKVSKPKLDINQGVEQFNNQIQNSAFNNNISENFVEEITYKTYETNKNKNNVEFVNINELLPLKNSGGFRTEEQINNLENAIRKNGMTEPIKLIRDEDGTIKIYDGNHRLEAARKLGLTEIPVKFINGSIDSISDIRYNNLKGEYINENTTEVTERIIRNDGRKRNIKTGSNIDSVLPNGEKTLQNDDRIYPPLVGYNNRPSSNTIRTGDNKGRSNASNEVDTSKLSRENKGLDNSSFNLPIDKNNTSYQGNQFDKAHGRGITTDEFLNLQENKLADNAKENKEALRQLEKVRNNPEAEITIYRATPGDTINNGDWVFLTKDEADNWSRSPITKTVRKGFKIIEKQVKANEVDWSGKNLEFVYSPKTNMQDIKVPTSEDIKQLKNKNSNIPLAKDNGTLIIKAKNIAKELNGKKDLDIPIDKNLRRWSETSTNSEVLKDFVAIEDLDLDKITYTPISNKKTLENAQKKISTMTYEEGLNYVNAKMSDSKVDLTDLAVIDQLLVQAKQKGDYKTATELIMDKTILGTELGQMVQQYSMIGRTTPEGQLQMYQKIVNRAKAIGDKSFDGVEITPEMVEGVLKTYKSDGTYTQEDLDNNMEIFKQQIVDQMKSTTADKINGWRYLSMLGNPKTHLRNIISNVAMKETIKVKNAMARTLESVFITDKNKRTKTWKRASEDVKTFAKESAIELKDVIQGESKYGTATQLKMEKKVFNNKILEKISNFNSKALSTEDWWFSQSAYVQSLQEYLTARGITTKEQINNNTEIVEQAKLYAIEQSEIATFRQFSKVANYINKIENTNAVSKIVVGAAFPFKKTPINVAKTGVKYSPLGLIKNITYDAIQLKNGNINASQFIDNISQGLTGTSVMLLGYVLAKGGYITGDSDDDKEGKYDSQLGNQGYALKIGNKTYSLSWLSPVAMPLLMGANTYEELENKEGWDANIVIDTLAKTIDPVSEMSFISGLTDALSSYKQGSMQMLSSIAQNTTSNYAMQFIPTLLSQIASTADDKVRSTSVNRDSSFKFGDKLLKQAMYKIPGLRNMLPVATDIWGNEKTQSDSIVDRAFNSFISPFTTKEITTTALDTELKRVYKETGDTSVIPGVPQGYLKYDNEQYNMNSKEYTTYKKTYGTTASKYLNSLIENTTYKNAKDDTKAKMVENIYKYSKALANDEFFKGRNINYSSNDLKNINNLLDLNMSDSEIGNYVAINTESTAIKNDKNFTSTEKHQQIAKNIINSNLSDKQLAYLYGNYYSNEETLNNLLTMNIPIKEFIKLDSENITGDYNTKIGKTISGSKKNKVINYVNSLKLSIPQKAILIKSQYSTYKDYDNEIINYVNKINTSSNEKKMLLKSIGFNNYNNDIVNYINSQNISKADKEKKLKSLGFTIRDGRVYW